MGGGEVGGGGGVIPDSSQSLPPLMHMGYAARHPGQFMLRTRVIYNPVMNIYKFFGDTIYK